MSAIRLACPVKSIEENHPVQSLKSALCRRTSVIGVPDQINEISPKPCSCRAICDRKIAPKNNNIKIALKLFFDTKLNLRGAKLSDLKCTFLYKLSRIMRKKGITNGQHGMDYILHTTLR